MLLSKGEVGSSIALLKLGGIIQKFTIAGRNIVLGLPDEDAYKKYNQPYFGATIGRTTNRLKDCVLTNVNGKNYTITTRQGPNSLHGGETGWDSRIFDGPTMVTRNGKQWMEFKYLSVHGEEGYPGTVELRVWYTVGKETNGDDPSHDKTTLEMEYEVEFVGKECAETVVSVTNHSYFNIGDSETIDGTHAILCTDKYLPTDSTGIPLGTIEPYPILEVKQPFILGESDPKFDTCFIMDTNPGSIPLDTRSKPLELLASFKHPDTGLNLEVFSTEPAFQFYTGDGVDVPAVEEFPAKGPRSGFCVEPGRYINAPNEPEWRNMCLLKQGGIWGSRSVYKTWK
ncbi:hypothetical protein FQN57_002209 [Myotisia sp. PD_48]|nr:hypothetical protein FQN57_002209 [Myotisia sp. PD_48]